MDLGVQAGHVSNQTRIYALDPDARSRLNTVYMVCYFVGGALGSFLGTWAWHRAGWIGVCGTAILVSIIALTFYQLNARRFTKKTLEQKSNRLFQGLQDRLQRNEIFGKQLFADGFEIF